MDLYEHVPSKYHSYLTPKPTKVTEITDDGIVAYHGESNVKLVTLEFGTMDNSKRSVILPALVNTNNNGKLTQISVIIHM